jgi:imidazolonepropionase
LIGGVRLSTILVRSARQLLTLRGSQEPRRRGSLNEVTAIPDGAVLIRDGLIVEVGPTRRLENLAGVRHATEIDASGRVVMPGFVDSHTHLTFPSAPGDDLEAARRVRTSSGQRIEARARTSLASMARHGTTTVEAKTGSGTDESVECKLLRVLSALQGDPLDVVSSFLCRLPHDDAAAAVKWIAGELLPKIQKRKIARFADIMCNGDPANIPLYDYYLRAARALGFPCKIHAGCSQPAEAIALAAKHSATSIDHLEHATPEDAKQLGAAGIIATLFPISCFYDGGPQAPARALIDAGAAVAIATNFDPQHSPTLNMQTAVALACIHFGMSIEEAIVAATINGAHALGRARRIGSLEPGKVADLVVLNVSHYQDLRHSLGTNVVHQTVKSGKIIYQEGDVATRPTYEARLVNL